jgi:hypothetical protein
MRLVVVAAARHRVRLRRPEPVVVDQRKQQVASVFKDLMVALVMDQLSRAVVVVLLRLVVTRVLLALERLMLTRRVLIRLMA